ncbi:hypothetical protein DPMN_114983 [Dreissena polymorpha]|uniref:C-type lectin domain-containing protein n=1 Tax=Dreissena polymorpha TaxID=45954 RepID=A0A9D4KL36_DREPO|nr:hypothetical protein DPMN_114983 [Dreissena polymorpha]
MYCYLPDSTLPTAEPIPSVCDIQQGQEQFQTSCYFYVSTPGNWTDADQGCMTQGSTTALVFTSLEENFFIKFNTSTHF